MEKKTEKGAIKYRMPNILEAYDLLDASGIQLGKTNLNIKRNIIASMGYLIDHKEICETYEELLSMTDEMIIPLSEIADEVLLKTFEVFKKKSS